MTIEKLDLDVEGMSCGRCEAAVKKAVGALNGVDSVDVDLKAKKVTVSLDTAKASAQKVKDAIEGQGFIVK